MSKWMNGVYTEKGDYYLYVRGKWYRNIGCIWPGPTHDKEQARCRHVSTFKMMEEVR